MLASPARPRPPQIEPEQSTLRWASHCPRRAQFGVLDPRLLQVSGAAAPFPEARSLALFWFGKTADRVLQLVPLKAL